MDIIGLLERCGGTGRTAGRRIAAHRRGSVLPMAAAALVPMLAMIGGAIDLSRLYMTNTRLQQACDAGALAGRRAMADVNTLSANEANTAKSYFSFNFPDKTYSASAVTANYTRGAVGTVIGTASAALPMTIMALFGYRNMTLNVSCQSTLVVPNTDVMFVLDVTGSMNDTAAGDTQSKIAGLRQAVKDFYSALGPGTASGPGRVRYGFMPYSSNVNVGKIVYGLNRSYIAGGNGPENWSYQSRRANLSSQYYISDYGTESARKQTGSSNGTATYGTNWANLGTSAGGYPSIASNSINCSSKAAPPEETITQTTASPENIAYPDTNQTTTYTTTTRKRKYRYDYNNLNCRLQYIDSSNTSTSTATTDRTVKWDRKFLSWTYTSVPFDVSQVVQNGTAANPTYFTGYSPDVDPNINKGDNRYTIATPSTITWNGCIEEAKTVSTITATSSLDIPAGAYDLNIDLVPYDTDTRWKPFLPAVQFDTSELWLGRGPGWIDNGFAVCPREASPLTQYQSDYNATTRLSAGFEGYVNSLTAVGGTYHDIGLIWGGRFLSQSGIYAATNADSTGPGGFGISRHIVFMTDGTLDTREYANDPWGINELQGLIAPRNTDEAGLEAIHKRRTSMICNAMKGKGFTVWVVGFGISTMPQELQECATDTAHWSLSSNSTQLRTRFQQIAQTIGGLRLSQ